MVIANPILISNHLLNLLFTVAFVVFTRLITEVSDATDATVFKAYQVSNPHAIRWIQS